jgi:hypothetical protein
MGRKGEAGDFMDDFSWPYTLEYSFQYADFTITRIVSLADFTTLHAESGRY